MEPVIGIIGGMGPEATVELFRLIVALTPAETDQEHFRILIDNNPKVPDRTAAIQGRGEDVLPVLENSGRMLQEAGASFIAIPCNTAHYWLKELRQSLAIPVIDMIGESALEASKHPSPIKKIGLLATTGTVEAGLYQKALAVNRIEVAVPEPAGQAQVMDAIYRVKAGDYSGKENAINVGHRLLAQGADGILLGCTEIPLLVGGKDFTCPVFNPLEILAQKSVEFARGSVRP